jgi:hypothetical protein
MDPPFAARDVRSLNGVRSVDTTDDAREVLVAVRRALGDDCSVLAAVQLSEDVRTLMLDGLRGRNPGVSESELVLLLIDVWHGAEAGAAARIVAAGR